MKITQINISDTKGGACVVSWNLHQGLTKKNHESYIAVKYKFSQDKNVITIDNKKNDSKWSKLLSTLADSTDRMKFAYNNKVAALFRFVARPGKMIRKKLGIEEFNFPESLKAIPHDTQIIHCHVLHGDYFDLRNLYKLSEKFPVFVTVHDAWFLSGHCAHSFDCELWKSGCSKCPDLSIPVPLERDNAAYNWKRKRNIYRKSKLYLATPCQWMMNKVDNSILKAALVQQKVIPNGVNGAIYKPASQKEARHILQIEQDADILLFSANGITKSRWKDYLLMRNALEIIGKTKRAKKIIFLALGEKAPNESIGYAELRFIPFLSDVETVARYYQASDIYLHGARADTFPNSILEALSCGVPVIATAVGGIPEQVKGWKGFEGELSEINSYELNESTGILVEPGNAQKFAEAIIVLLDDEEKRTILSLNAYNDAVARFSMEKQINEYIGWYQQILNNTR